LALSGTNAEERVQEHPAKRRVSYVLQTEANTDVRPSARTGSNRALQRQFSGDRFALQTAQAPAADPQLAFLRAVAHRLLVKVKFPLALSAIMSMADTMAELRAFAADITFPGHYLTSQGTITNVKSTIIRRFRQIARELFLPIQPTGLSM